MVCGYEHVDHDAGSEVAGEAAAALAATYIVLRQQGQSSAAGKYLTHAKQLYALASNYPGSYQSQPAKSCLGTLGVRAKSARCLTTCNHICCGLACLARFRSEALTLCRLTEGPNRVELHLPLACARVRSAQAFQPTPSRFGRDRCCSLSQSLYASTGYVDELAWAAAWLYKATGSATYLTAARYYYSRVRRLQSAWISDITCSAADHEQGRVASTSAESWDNKTSAACPCIL